MNPKALLDTNIIIHRENVTVSNKSIGLLFYWLDKMHYLKMIHPLSVNELRKYKQNNMQELYDAKLTSYEIMHTVSEQTEEFKALLVDAPKTVNDEIDNQLLFETYIGKADVLITEDRRMRRKAELVGIATRVFSINSFIEKMSSENPQLVSYKALSVKKDYFGNINLADSFFDSLRNSYSSFDKWFKSKSEEEAYICYDDGKKILGFLYLKTENAGEDYGVIEPPFLPKKRLKIGTFKVESTGFRLGERFVKIIFDNAIERNVDEIYVTLFDDREELKALSDLLKRWGFANYGNKLTDGKSETVLIKKMREYDVGKSVRDNFPNVDYRVSKYILPIAARFHTPLLPDSALLNENEGDYIQGQPFRYALQKVYITWAGTDEIRSGDILLFYRMGETYPKKYSSVITTVGIVDEVISSFVNKDDFMSVCQNRSVFSKEDLEGFWRSHSRNLSVVKFVYCKDLVRKVTLGELWDMGVVEVPNGPRPFHRLSDEQFDSIVSSSNTKLYKR